MGGNIMKKFIHLFLCTALFFVMTACSSKIDDKAIDAYIEASAAFREYKSLVYDASTSFKMGSVLDESFTMKGAYNAKKDTLDFKTGIYDTEDKEIANLYVKDDFLYIQMLNEKIKYDLRAYLPLLASIMQETKNTPIDKEEVKKQLTSASLKNHTIHLKFDTKGINDVLKTALEKEKELQEAGASFSCTKLEVKETLEDNKPVKLEYNLALLVTVQGQSQTLDVTFACTLSSINQDVKIDFPKDLDTYTLTTFPIENQIENTTNI